MWFCIINNLLLVNGVLGFLRISWFRVVICSFIARSPAAVLWTWAWRWTHSCCRQMTFSNSAASTPLTSGSRMLPGKNAGGQLNWNGDHFSFDKSTNHICIAHKRLKSCQEMRISLYRLRPGRRTQRGSSQCSPRLLVEFFGVKKGWK